ncbi:MAG: hypothetical protein QM817_22770 [Archangium sp.]
MMITALALLLLGDVVFEPVPKIRPPDQCSADSDCELSTFQGCCGSCCPAPPHAIRKGSNEGARCAVIDCALPNCDAVRCMRAPEPVSSYLAICRVGQCVAVMKPIKQTAVCRVDDECRVVQLPPSPGQCCGIPAAQPIDAPLPQQPKRTPPVKNEKKGDGPQFGLSTGDGTGPRPQLPQNCGVCPAPTNVRAACSAGQCVLTPNRPIPIPPG